MQGGVVEGEAAGVNRQPGEEPLAQGVGELVDLQQVAAVVGDEAGEPRQQADPVGARDLEQCNRHILLFINLRAHPGQANAECRRQNAANTFHHEGHRGHEETQIFILSLFFVLFVFSVVELLLLKIRVNL